MHAMWYHKQNPFNLHFLLII